MLCSREKKMYMFVLLPRYREAGQEENIHLVSSCGISVLPPPGHHMHVTVAMVTCTQTNNSTHGRGASALVPVAVTARRPERGEEEEENNNS